LEISRKLSGLRKSKPNQVDPENLFTKESWKKMKANTHERELKNRTHKKATLLTTDNVSIQKANFPEKVALCFPRKIKISFQLRKIHTLSIAKLSRTLHKIQQLNSVSGLRWIVIPTLTLLRKKLKDVPEK
jgi:hypothetical protein